MGVGRRDKAILHDIDRYAFMVLCPFILVLQLMIIAIYYRYSNLMQRPRNIFFGIVVFELLINLHFLATSSTLLSIKSTTLYRTLMKPCQDLFRYSAWSMPFIQAS